MQKGITWTIHLCANPTVKKIETIGSFIKNATKKQIQICTGGFCTKSPMSRCFATTIIVHKTFAMLEHCGIKSMLRRSSFDKMKLRTSILRGFCAMFVPIPSATKKLFGSRVGQMRFSHERKCAFANVFLSDQNIPRCLLKLQEVLSSDTWVMRH